MSADATIWHDIHCLAEKAAREFDLRWPIVFKPVLAKHRGTHYGMASRKPPTIGIRVHVCGRPSRPLSRGTIMATLAHELGHLHRRGWNHGREHRELVIQIRQWLREQGQPIAGRV